MWPSCFLASDSSVYAVSNREHFVQTLSCFALSTSDFLIVNSAAISIFNPGIHRLAAM